MVAYLSPEWIAELDRSLAADPGVAAATTGVALTVQQVVTGGPDGEVAWAVAVDHGRVAVRPGRAEASDVTFTSDHDTAVAVARGELSAQAAFMVGRLTVTGDVAKLITHQDAFTSIDDATDALRAATVLDPSDT